MLRARGVFGTGGATAAVAVVGIAASVRPRFGGASPATVLGVLRPRFASSAAPANLALANAATLAAAVPVLLAASAG